jgi:hypothetical protein
MANYVLAFRGGGVPATEEERQQAMAAWGAWFGGLGNAVVDTGNPFGDSRSLASDGSDSNGNGSGLSGYTILSAGDMDEAVGQARGCPLLQSGGSIDVYEVTPIM